MWVIESLGLLELVGDAENYQLIDWSLDPV